MEIIDLESNIRNAEFETPIGSSGIVLGANGTRKDAIYKAVIALSRSLAGHTDLRSLVSGVAESLRPVLRFDHVGLVLHDPKGNSMQGYILNEPGNPVITCLRLPIHEDPAGWVWLNQQSVVLSNVQTETRWAEGMRVARGLGINTLALIPLTAGNNRLGALGLGSVAPLELSPAEIAFLERVSSELAVAVESFLARQEATRERERLRTLCDITNALVSHLGRDELLSAISVQLSNVVAHDHAMLTLCDGTRGLERYTLHSTGPQIVEESNGPFDPTGMPAAEVLATGKPVVACDNDVDRYPALSRFLALGFRSICSVPLITRERPFGTLALCRITEEEWTPNDIDFLAQVACQIAVAMENSLTYRELAEMKERLATEKLYLEDEIRLDHNIGNMVGEGPAFQAVLKSIQTVAPTDATVLITGETGAGKELVARAIHDLSRRKKGSFVVVNCAAIPASLLESELFGHEKGSFTGALAQKIGRFELAHQGTLFLDEIGEMPLELQPKLLRAIQDQEFERVGGNRTIHTDVRFVAATNRNLKAMVKENRFRADLYYRLHVFPLEVPPLRDRREDIPLLTRYFVQKHSKRMGREIDSIPTSVMNALTSYDWPGNIRELQNVIERSVILSGGPELRVPLSELAANSTPQAVHAPISNACDPGATERARILEVLKEARGQVGGSNGAAARLGLKRTTLQSRMRKYNIGRLYQ